MISRYLKIILFFSIYSVLHGRVYPQNQQLSFYNQNCLVKVVLSGQNNIVWQLGIEFYKENQLSNSQHIKLGYPVYQATYGDIDGDGSKEILIGVIKKAHFHKIMAKRLFIYDIKEKYIAPQLLCSRVGDELLDFKVVSSPNGDAIRTLEKNGTIFGIFDYRWGNFSILRIKKVIESGDYEAVKKVYYEKK